MTRYLALALLLFSSCLQAAIQEKTVDYRSGDTALKGYLVWDDAVAGKRPAVLVVHEWWGLNDYAKRRARMLAELGYTALAVDMYGDGKNTEHPEEAQGFMQAVLNGAGVAQQRFLAAKSLLEQEPTVDAGKIAAIGYCFGGATVLDMARQGVDLAAVVSFHGNLVTQTPAAKGKVKARVLVLNGADDKFVTADSIAALKKEMKSAGARYRFVNYPGAKHSFTNPDADRIAQTTKLDIAYQPEADRKSWDAMQALFRVAFGKPRAGHASKHPH
ncbi:dienelactone hydrolase family protein [Methylococcus sp. EFPC2]|uniref:dienelactone hydrolase family protein n=1 Tax=Methylococcus sp. EFPC2 TaxID=2812648 RepID=UPI0019670A1E|nr:dienelactone hydrolase family protein [Methylococcus sp. EFPC2]QSA96446.1 dienelactone hydrolase family protein [Methylococcus sp. EFPC2]